jgi:hypothetical protein
MTKYRVGHCDCVLGILSNCELLTRQTNEMTSMKNDNNISDYVDRVSRYVSFMMCLLVSDDFDLCMTCCFIEIRNNRTLPMNYSRNSHIILVRILRRLFVNEFHRL